MDFDFSAFLVLASAVTGGIWGLDRLLLAPRRAAAGRVKEPVLVEYARSFFPVIFVVLLLRSFLVEPFRIPSGSMMPTLLVGDFILVNKFSYGVRLPVLDTKFLDVGAPERGDVVVFRYPKDPSTDYIKRVVGLPGDLIAYYDRMLFVNGKPMAQVPVGRYIGTGGGAMMTGAGQRLENLDGIEHAILVREGQPTPQLEYRVPEGHYFVMGDNRDNSNDSRFWGPVPEANLVGKAFLIWMSWDGGPQWQRIGDRVH